ncbi:MAG: hypothetical protein ACLTSX_10985 [Collinsella sp.]
MGALVVGVAFAKRLRAMRRDKPLICVNHLEGHLLRQQAHYPRSWSRRSSSRSSRVATPCSCTCAHWGDYEVLGETLDDAVGEAFDKVAKALGLGYPGGPIISRLAEDGNPKAIDFPRALNSRGDYRFSLSGLKTAVTPTSSRRRRSVAPSTCPTWPPPSRPPCSTCSTRRPSAPCGRRVRASTASAVVVAANPHLRQMMIEKLGRQGIRVTVPPQNACTDNAAMIAVVAREKFLRGEFAEFTVDADPNMTL